MSKRWLTEKRSDGFYKMAKREGYRSRAAYKLKQIQERHKVIKTGDYVLDLGSAPGGWLQMGIEMVGPQGKVVGIDLQRIAPIEGATILRGDVTKKSTQDKLIALSEEKLYDVVISDMAPEMSGNYSIDHAKSIYLTEMAIEVASRMMRKNGNFVGKVFQGEMIEDLLADLKKQFWSVKRYSPEASRSRSAEVFLICKGFNGKIKKPPEPEEPPVIYH